MMFVVTRIEQLVEALGAIARACVLLLVLLVSFDVLMRYLFDLSPVALQELEWYLISPIALLGIAYTLKHRQDVRVDFLYDKFGVKTKAAVDLVEIDAVDAQSAVVLRCGDATGVIMPLAAE